jgi:PilZ domain
MFKEAVASLGRWVGLAQASAESILGEERRVWIRYPSMAQTTCQPAAPANSTPITARVRDISRGGIHLLVDRWFEAGMLLSIQLPSENHADQDTVLAYVVRSVLQDDGQWVLGCTFATELDAADLQTLEVPRVRSESADQRTWERTPSDISATYQAVKTDAPNPRGASVLNVSPTGVALVVGEIFEVGTLLNLELRSADGRSALVILASVVRVHVRHGQSAEIGCNFIRELSHKELKALL